MKKTLLIAILISFLFPAFTFSQIIYVNTGFEKTDTAGKALIQWKTLTKETRFMLDSTNKAFGKYSLYFENYRGDYSGQTFVFNLPKSCFKGMRTIEITVKIREQGRNKPAAGLSCKVKKNKKLLGWASTYKGQLAFPMDINDAMVSENMPISPWAWTTYSISIPVKEDPDEVSIFGFSVGSAWFDDLQISINGQLVNNLVIPLQIDTK